MVNSITKLSPVKINLYLEVLNKTKSGYHNLESLMTLCDCGDVINIKKASEFKLSIDGPFAKGLVDKNNIILKSFSLIEKVFRKNFYVHINLTKNLPISSGMGGGSSNAATTILCMKELFNLDLDRKFLKFLFSLGADVPFCYQRKSALVKGKGEIILPLKKAIPQYHVLLVNPLIEISTKKIFEKIKISKRTKNNFDEKLINNQQIINFLNLKKNDLEKEAILQCNQIKIILDFIKKKTKPLISRMTGSGATCFALYENHDNLEEANNLLKQKFKDYWVKKTKLANVL